MDALQREVGEWADATFPVSSRRGRVAHMVKELHELLDAQTPQEASEERADILIMLMHDAHKDGDSLVDAVRRKFEIVKLRTWGEPDADGVIEHIREAAQGGQAR